MIYSLKGDQFREWVSGLIRGRNEQLAEKNDLMIELDPQIAEAFKSSQNISSKCFLDSAEALFANPFAFFLQHTRAEAFTF